jgi:hypothetical protein
MDFQFAHGNEPCGPKIETALLPAFKEIVE